MTSSRGKSAKGSSAVAERGIASVTHQTAMSATTAVVRQPAADRPSGAGASNSATKATTPSTNPTPWERA